LCTRGRAAKRPARGGRRRAPLLGSSEGAMEQLELEEVARTVLHGFERYTARVRKILAEDVPVGVKTDRVARLREELGGEYAAILQRLDQEEQGTKKALLGQLARLRQLRDLAMLIRDGVLPMFASQEGAEREAAHGGPREHP